MAKGDAPSDAEATTASGSEAQKAKPKKRVAQQKTREQLMKNFTPKARPRVTEQPSFNRLQQYDYVREVTKKNVWYYRDRLSVPRGPCTLPVLRECWVNGVIDENTLIWGQGLIDWLPAKNIRTLVPQIRTPEVQFSTWIKKNFALKPAVARMRKRHPEKRAIPCDQVDDMY